MIHGIVEVATAGTHISKGAGHLIVKDSKGAEHRIDLDVVGALVLTARSATITTSILAECAARAIPVVISGPNYAPVATLMHCCERAGIADRIRAQVTATRPRMKRAWQSIVIRKIENQAKVLRELVGESEARKVALIAADVHSGDSTNREAYAARLYWQRLFGGTFKRDREAPGVNAALNYGYAVVRSAVARAVAACGLAPSIGVHHSNSHNPMCLVDDLMEPFRPIIDFAVASNGEWGELTAERKRCLAAVLQADMLGDKGVTTLRSAAYALGLSVVDYLLSKTDELVIATWDPANGTVEDTLSVRDYVDDCAV